MSVILMNVTRAPLFQFELPRVLFRFNADNPSFEPSFEEPPTNPSNQGTREPPPISATFLMCVWV